MSDTRKISILVSSCLLGEAVRYNGTAVAIDERRMRLLQMKCNIVSHCPEMSAGLGVPRLPVEITGGDGADVLLGTARVLVSTGEDLTQRFRNGAEMALLLCRKYKIRLAILTENSPSCGSSRIYDGSFQGVRIAGSGVTTVYLRNHGITVFSQEQLSRVFDYIEEMEDVGHELTEQD
jgi:uncharacterized protein YbbK (DUF523 family)